MKALTEFHEYSIADSSDDLEVAPVESPSRLDDILATVVLAVVTISGLIIGWVLYAT